MKHKHIAKAGKKIFKRFRRQLSPILKEIVMLALIGKKPTHGYKLMKEMTEAPIETKIKASSIYPELSQLKDKGLVEVSIDASDSLKRPRKVYSLTEIGKKQLLKDIEELRENLTSLDDYLELLSKNLKDGSAG
jgi:DNA-binding PadR family transcriptional regulator